MTLQQQIQEFDTSDYLIKYMKNKNYTKQNEHPEDRIFADAAYISRLGDTQTEVFNKLVADLNLNERGEEWLFDYVFNSDGEDSFEEYIEERGFTYSEFVKISE
jgi:hypothetical protein